MSFHKNNIQNRIPKLLELLKQGESIALISDAGIPGISDPGQELVHTSKSKGFKVVCIPGPCAAITALINSGLTTKRFCFEGFLPHKDKDRKKIIEEISTEERTIIIYESPHRILKLLEELYLSCGPNRPLEVGRELTKIYEETIGSTIQEVINHFKKYKPKGELTLVLGGASNTKNNQKNTSEMIKEIEFLINQGKSTSESIREVSEKYSYSRRELYSRLHQNSS